MHPPQEYDGVGQVGHMGQVDEQRIYSRDTAGTGWDTVTHR